MKLSISNIAWENNEFDEHIKLLGKLQCHGLELAPSCIWDEPVDTSKQQRQELKDKVAEQGLTVVGIHSLLFTRPDLQLFDTPESRHKTGEYLKKLFQLCADLGGRTLVLGSPKNRGLNGKSYQECIDIAIEFFKSIAPAAEDCNVVLCPEALSEKESNFLTSSHDAWNLVQEVSHPGIGMMLDVKAMIDIQENYTNLLELTAGELQHMHVGDEGLAPPGTAGFDHRLIGDAISDSQYNKYISIEMRRGFGPSKDVITKSVEYVRRCYPIEHKEKVWQDSLNL